jgi:membrane protease YdiL (CAAX protease family)
MLLPGVMVFSQALDRTSWPILLSLIFAPLIEEVVFRRGLQDELLRSPRLADWTACWGAAAHERICILITAVAFAAAHILVAPVWLAAATVLPALAIGALYNRQRRLAPCVLVHAVFNLVCLAWHAAKPAFA